MNQKRTTMQWFLAVPTAFGPYGAGFLVIVTRNIRLLALVGIAVCIGCTAGAYIVRKQNKPLEAKHRLIIDPMLYGFEFVLTAVLIRYLFLK